MNRATYGGCSVFRRVSCGHRLYKLAMVYIYFWYRCIQRPSFQPHIHPARGGAGAGGVGRAAQFQVFGVYAEFGEHALHGFGARFGQRCVLRPAVAGVVPAADDGALAGGHALDHAGKRLRRALGQLGAARGEVEMHRALVKLNGGGFHLLLWRRQYGGGREASIKRGGAGRGAVKLAVKVQPQHSAKQQRRRSEQCEGKGQGKGRALALGGSHGGVGRVPWKGARIVETRRCLYCRAMLNDIAHMRREFGRASLSQKDSLPDPLAQFDKWLGEARAAEVPDANAMTLATVDSRLRPSTRVVLIKGYDERGITWFTNYDSRKGRELAGNPWAALQFFWPEIERVVRIEGRVEKLDAAASDGYFATRPLESRIGAWASPQSQPIASRAWLVAEAARYGARFMLHPPRPPHWGGYRLRPDAWEFWQGRASRLHDRLRYRLVNGAWLRERLAP